MVYLHPSLEGAQSAFHDKKKTKLICAALAEEEASFKNGSSGGNAAKALQ